MFPKLSLVVPTHRRAKGIAALLNSLRGQSLSADQVEILIVSNFPDNALEAVIAAAHQHIPYKLELLVTNHLGVNSARNYGLKAAQGEIALLLDDDCYAPDTEFLERLLKTHEEFPEALAVGGAYLSPPKHSRVGVQYNWICNDWLNAQFVLPTPTSRLLGGCVSYKLVPLRQTGLEFNPAIRYGGSETEFHLRLVALGQLMVYHPQHTVVHDCKISGRDLSRKAYQQGMAKWERMKRGELEKTPPPTLGDPLLWKNKLKDSFYGQLHRHFFSRGYERAKRDKPPVGKLAFFITVVLSYLELFAMGFGFGYPLYKVLSGDQLETVRIYYFVRDAFWAVQNYLNVRWIRSRFAVQHWINITYENIYWAARKTLSKIRIFGIKAGWKFRGWLSNLAVLGIRTRYLIYRVLNYIKVTTYWTVRRFFSRMRIFGIKTRWTFQGWTNDVVVLGIRTKYLVLRIMVGIRVRIHRSYWWCCRRRSEVYNFFAFRLRYTLHRLWVREYWRAKCRFGDFRVFLIGIFWRIYRVFCYTRIYFHVRLIHAYWGARRWGGHLHMHYLVHLYWFVRHRISAVRLAAVGIYWLIRRAFAGVRLATIASYWLFYRALSRLRLAGINTYWTMYTWLSRKRVDLIRAYWRFYPLACHIKGYWRSPRHLILRGLKLKMPLNYPMLTTEGAPLWAAPLQAEDLRKSPQQLIGQWRALGLHAVEVGSTDWAERAYMQTVNFPCHIMHSAMSEVQPATGERRNIIVLTLTEIAAQSAQILDWLRSVQGQVSLLLTVDADVTDEAVREFLNEISSLSRVSGLSLQFDTRTHIEFGEGMRFFRWLYQLSLHAEGLRLKWQPYYRYLSEREVLREKLVPLPMSTAAAAPEVSVLIPHHRDFNHLQTTLQHLQRQTLVSEKFEVIVIDNGIEGHLLETEQREALQTFDLNLTVLTMQSPDAELFLSGQARNRGLHVARGRIIQFLDSDILLPANYLSNLVAEMKTSDVIMAKRSMLKEGVRKIDEAATYAEDEYWENFKRAKAWTDLREFWKYSCTYCLAVKREWLQQAGPFDPKFTMYGFEDVDLGFRLFKLQARFSFANDRVFHLYPSRDQHNYHVDMQRRAQALSRSALTLFMSRPETVTFGLCQGYFAPTLIQWLWQGTKGAAVWSAGALTPRWIRVTSASR